MSRRSAADGAVVNARIRTLDPARPDASAAAFREGTIVAVGSDAEVREACDAATEVRDAGGAALVPGITDAHIHPFWAEVVAGADLTRCATLADLRDSLARERSRAGAEGWVRGWGLSYEVFHGSEIDGRLIEDAVAGGPALVTFMDQHTALATPRALELAGVGGAVAFEEGAEVVVRDGAPTGELREAAAMELVRAVLPPLGDDETYAQAVAIQAQLHEVGVTGVHVMNGDRELLALLGRLEANGELALRCVVPLWQKPETSFEEMESQLELRGAHGRLWRCGVAKFFIDGVIDTGTGWLEEPDTLGDGREPFWPDPDRYVRAVRLFAAAGFQCATHAVGDRAVRAALDAYRRAGAPARGRHRIEHIETLPAETLRRFAAEGVAASMQPLHMQWRRDDLDDSWARRLGPERAARAFPTGDLLGSGAVLALGSDWPVAQYDPRIGMAWARLRRTPGVLARPPFEPAQRLDAEAALAGYTTGAAAVVGEEARSGRIAPGYRADLSGFAEDPVDCRADDLPGLPVRLVIVDGQVVFPS